MYRAYFDRGRKGHAAIGRFGDVDLAAEEVTLEGLPRHMELSRSRVHYHLRTLHERSTTNFDHHAWVAPGGAAIRGADQFYRAARIRAASGAADRFELRVTNENLAVRLIDRHPFIVEDVEKCVFDHCGCRSTKRIA